MSRCGGGSVVVRGNYRHLDRAGACHAIITGSCLFYFLLISLIHSHFDCCRCPPASLALCSASSCSSTSSPCATGLKKRHRTFSSTARSTWPPSRCRSAARVKQDNNKKHLTQTVDACGLHVISLEKNGEFNIEKRGRKNNNTLIRPRR